MADDRRREPMSVIERFGFLHRAILRDRFGNVTMPVVVAWLKATYIIDDCAIAHTLD
jgi:hypothetical protein